MRSDEIPGKEVSLVKYKELNLEVKVGVVRTREKKPGVVDTFSNRGVSKKSIVFAVLNTRVNRGGASFLGRLYARGRRFEHISDCARCVSSSGLSLIRKSIMVVIVTKKGAVPATTGVVGRTRRENTIAVKATKVFKFKGRGVRVGSVSRCSGGGPTIRRLETRKVAGSRLIVAAGGLVESERPMAPCALSRITGVVAVATLGRLESVGSGGDSY